MTPRLPFRGRSGSKRYGRVVKSPLSGYTARERGRPEVSSTGRSSRRSLDGMDFLVGVFAALIPFAILAVLALRFGAESRPGFDERPIRDDRPNW